MARSLRTAAKSATAPQEVFEAANATVFAEFHIRPVQVPAEIGSLLEIARAEQPLRVLEIGTANAGTLYLLAWASAPGASLLSLDLRAFDPAHQRMIESFVDDRRIVLMQGNSQLEQTLDEVARFFGTSGIDLLFIDGDHAGENVRRDYELYAPLVRRGGLIAFHDIVDGPPDLVGGVPQFWREVRSELADPIEIVESWSQGGFGIGVGRMR